MRVLAALLCVMVTGASAASAQDITYGTGIFLNERGEVLTNRHVVDSCPSVYVRTASGQSYPATVVVKGKSVDMAVVRATGFTPPEFATLAAAAGGARTAPGENVVYGGYDRGMTAMNFAEGAVVDPPGDVTLAEGVSAMASDAAQGASGSGVFEVNHGALVGLMFSAYFAGERARAHRENDLSYGDNLIQFYTADTVARFLEREAQIRFTRAADTAPRSWGDIRAHVYGATALVLCGA